MVRAALLEINHSASERAIEVLRLEAKSKYTTYYKDWADAVKKAEGKVRLERLKRSNERNRRRKARPSKTRALFSSQQEHNYGYDNTVIEEGFVKGSFRRGWGFQPFLSLNKEDYENAVVASDYDALISVIEIDKHSEQTIAEDILAFIDHKTEPKEGEYSAKTLRAMATLILLTQYIEPHDRRITGADKWGRACFSNILNNGSSFRKEFNRKNGNYLPARAKKGGSKFGGQESSRIFLGLKKKSDKAKFSDVFSEKVLEPLEELSDSSEEEGDL